MTEPQADAQIPPPPPIVTGSHPFAVVAYPVQPAREKRRQHLCACSWGVKCKALRDLFSTRNGDPRGGDPRSFDLTSERNKIWKSCIEVNLKVDMKSLTEKQLKKVRVAKHHWNRQQNLAYPVKRGGGKSINTPIPRDEIMALLDDESHFNQRFKVKKKLLKKNEQEHYLFFNHPNVSLASLCEELKIDIDESGVVTPRVPTARELRAQRQQAAAEEQRDRIRRQEYESLSYESWWASQDANTERQKSLELQVQRLEAEQKQMRAFHDQQVKEKSQQIRLLKNRIASRDHRKRLVKKGPPSSQPPSKRQCARESPPDGNDGSAAGSFVV